MDLFYMKHRTYMDVVLLGTVILRFQLHVRNYVKISNECRKISILNMRVLSEQTYISSYNPSLGSLQ